MKTETMLYLVTEYAPNGEIFGKSDLGLSVTQCSYGEADSVTGTLVHCAVLDKIRVHMRT